jgi:hypothetical protein
MATLQTAQTTNGRCIERLIQYDYDANGNTIQVPITPWRPCNTSGRYWGRVGNTPDPNLGNAQRLISGNGTMVDDSRSQPTPQPYPPKPPRILTDGGTIETETVFIEAVETMAENESSCGCKDSSDPNAPCTCARRKAMIIGAVALVLLAALWYFTKSPAKKA